MPIGMLTILATLLLLGDERRSGVPSAPPAYTSAVAVATPRKAPARVPQARVAPLTESRPARPRSDARAPETADPVLTPSAPEQQKAPANPGLPPTRLSWSRVPRATSYEIALVRSGREIFRARSGAAEARVPRVWRHSGVTYRIRPEDQAFVWAIVDGRRGGRPVVDGVLALDLMLGPLVSA